MSGYDVIVVGLGGMGSAVACHLARRGRKVLGLDRYQPPHDRGSSHGSTRVIRQAYFEHPDYVPLLLRAYELWRELEGVHGEALLESCGGLMMGAPGSEVVTGSLASARLHDLPHELLETRELRRRYPVFRVPDGTVALLERAAGFLRCEPAVAAHLDQAARAGADLRYRQPVLEWEAAAGRVRVRTASGDFRAEQLVMAPGPWAPELLGEWGGALAVERQVSCWFDPPGGIAPFTRDRFPIYIWERAPGVSPYGFPAVDGPAGGVKIAYYRKPRVEACTADTVDRTLRVEDEEDLREVVRDFLPALDGRLIRGTTCLYTLTPDLHFVIDRHPRHPEVIVTAGFSGHGFKFCSVVGEVVADLATRGRSEFRLGLFAAGAHRRRAVPVPGGEA